METYGHARSGSRPGAVMRLAGRGMALRLLAASRAGLWRPAKRLTRGAAGLIGTSLLLTMVFAPPASAATFTATEGAQFSGALATAGCTLSSTPTPTINWGDGTSSPASFTTTVPPAPLSGSHT